MSDPDSNHRTPSQASAAPAPRKVSSLRDLPLEIAPPRDLWPQLEARLVGTGAVRRRLLPSLPVPRPRYFAAAAALVAAVAVGVLIGRGLHPPGSGSMSVTASPMIPASFVSDPRYLRERAQLLQSLNARLAALPPQSRQKVLASLATIHQSMRDIQAALGREPGNALLQELLVDTYQDEMQVLTTVQETGSGET